jgi:predicted dehydrogenase
MIRIAVAGAGHWGPNLIRNFHNNHTSEVAWVADRDASRLEQVNDRFPDVRLAANIEPALKDSSVDAVVVATPTSTHYAVAKAALQAGKHVLVEKPIAQDSEEGLELVELAQKTKRVLLVGHVFVYNPAVRRVKHYLAEQTLGRVYYVSMIRTNLGPIRVDVNAAWDLASHDISIVNYWLGSEPTAASAVGGVWINDGVEDTVFATLHYPDNVLVNVHASWLNPRKAREITVVGEKKMLTFDDTQLTEPLRIYDKQVTDTRTRPGFIDTFASFRASIRDGDITIPKVASGEPLKIECDHFLDCIQGKATPITDGRAGVAVVRTLEAIAQSVKNHGREEKVRV